MFGVKEVERPASVLVAALDHGFDGITDAAVGFDFCVEDSTSNIGAIARPAGVVRSSASVRGSSARIESG
jgi:hypothetical protein